MSKLGFIEVKAEDLPSHGIRYPEGTIFEITRHSYGEIYDTSVDRYSLPTRIKIFGENLKSNTGVTIDNLLYLDYLYMNILRTASVYNNDKFYLPVVCPNCEKPRKENYVIDYNKIEIKDINDYIDILPFQIPVGGQILEFKHITVPELLRWHKLINNISLYDRFTEVEKEYQKVMAQQEGVENKVQDYTEEEIKELSKLYRDLKGRITNKVKSEALLYNKFSFSALLLGAMSVSIDSPEYLKVLETIQNARGEEIEDLSFVEDTLGVGLKPYKLTCKHCGTEFEVSLEEYATSIYPFRRDDNTIGCRIRNYKKAELHTKSDKGNRHQQDTQTV